MTDVLSLPKNGVFIKDLSSKCDQIQQFDSKHKLILIIQNWLYKFKDQQMATSKPICKYTETIGQRYFEKGFTKNFKCILYKILWRSQFKVEISL